MNVPDYRQLQWKYVNCTRTKSRSFDASDALLVIAYQFFLHSLSIKTMRTLFAAAVVFPPRTAIIQAYITVPWLLRTLARRGCLIVMIDFTFTCVFSFQCLVYFSYLTIIGFGHMEMGRRLGDKFQPKADLVAHLSPCNANGCVSWNGHL